MAMSEKNRTAQLLAFPADELRVRVREQISTDSQQFKLTPNLVDSAQKKIKLNGASFADVLDANKIQFTDFTGIDNDIDFAKKEAVKLIDSYNNKEENKLNQKRAFLTNKRLATIHAKELIDNFDLVDFNKVKQEKLETKVWFDATAKVLAFNGQPVGNGQFIRKNFVVDKEDNS